MNDKTSIREFIIDSLKKFYSNLNIPKTGNSKIFYGTCNTAAETTTKVVTCADFTVDDLVEGVMMLVKFSNTNSGAVESLKLKINDIAASEASIKKMYATESSNAAISNLSQTKEITAEAVLLFIYTGTYWLVAGLDINYGYSSMTVAEYQAGIGITDRTITPARLKGAITYWMTKNQSNWKVTDDTSPSYIYNKPPIDHIFTNVISGEHYPGAAYISTYSMQQTSAILAYGSYSFSENNSFAFGVNSHSEGYSNVLYKFDGKYTFAGDISSDTDFFIDEISYINISPIFNYFNDNHIPVYILLKEAKDNKFCLLRKIEIIDNVKDYYMRIDESFNLKEIIDDFDIYILSYGSLGENSHSEGLNTIALGSYSHSEGSYTIAYHDNEHVCGIYNYWENNIESIFSVGVGNNEQDRRTAFTVLKDGTAYLMDVGDFNGHTFLCKSLQTTINNKVDKNELISQSYVTAFNLSSQGYLTSESDPIFTASAAHGITSTDITNWNNKVSKDELSAQGYVSCPMTITDYGYAKLGTNTILTINNANKVYPIGMTSSGELAVNVPWVSGSGGENVQSDWEEDDTTETSYILHKPPVGNSKIFYGTCNTAAATTTKVVTCTNFTEDDLVEGVIMLVKFSVTNSGAVADLKLKINDIAASEASIKKMYATGSSNAAINNLSQVKEITADAVLPFIYTGTYWLVAGLDINYGYTSMTVAEYQAGTSTGSRSITPARLKGAITYWMTKNQSDWNESDDTSPSYILNKPTIKTINGNTMTGSGDVSINELPTVTSSDNGKVLMVVNGAWSMVTPVTIYTGSDSPNNNNGNNGDIYLQI